MSNQNSNKYLSKTKSSSIANITLLSVVQHGDIQAVKSLINKGTPLDIKNPLGDTALHIAVTKNYINIVELLIDKGADVKEKNIFGNMPLHLAVLYANYDIVKLLLIKKRADIINEENKYGKKAIDLARQYGHTSIVRLLAKEIEKDANINTKSIFDNRNLIILGISLVFIGLILEITTNITIGSLLILCGSACILVAFLNILTDIKPNIKIENCKVKYYNNTEKNIQLIAYKNT